MTSSFENELGREPGESEFSYGKGIQASATQRALTADRHGEIDELTPSMRLRSAHLINSDDYNLDEGADESLEMQNKYEREA